METEGSSQHGSVLWVKNNKNRVRLPSYETLFINGLNVYKKTFCMRLHSGRITRVTMAKILF